jgi:hypothetical protein
VIVVPRATARAIDRFARGAHAFHRFAHHPLCGEYAGEVVRVGRRARLCRGCAFVAAGALLGAFVSVPLPIAALQLPVALVLATQARAKLVSRFLPATFAAAAVGSGARSASFPGAALAVAGLALVALAVLAYRRRGPNRAPCATCPERTGAVPCRGYAPIVRRERAFRRLAARRFRFEELERPLDPAPLDLAARP